MLWLWSWLQYCRGVDLRRKRCRLSRAQMSRHRRRIHQALALMLLVARSRKTLRVRRTFVFLVLRVTGTNRVSSVTKSPGMGVHGFVPRQESIVLRKVVLSAFQMERWLKDRRALSIRNRADDAPLSRPTRSTGPPPPQGYSPSVRSERGTSEVEDPGPARTPSLDGCRRSQPRTGRAGCPDERATRSRRRLRCKPCADHRRF